MIQSVLSLEKIVLTDLSKVPVLVLEKHVAQICNEDHGIQREEDEEKATNIIIEVPCEMGAELAVSQLLEWALSDMKGPEQRRCNGRPNRSGVVIAIWLPLQLQMHD